MGQQGPALSRGRRRGWAAIDAMVYLPLQRAPTVLLIAFASRCINGFVTAEAVETWDATLHLHHPETAALFDAKCLDGAIMERSAAVLPLSQSVESHIDGKPARRLFRKSLCA